MPTIFTRARAAEKVIALLERECGLSRETLRCDSRLESDLGVAGDDAYELLHAMQQDLGVDLSDFDGDDSISPEGMTPLEMILMIGTILATLAAFLWFVPTAPPWLQSGTALAVAFAVAWGVDKLRAPRPELTLRDLVLSVEAGRWISPIRPSTVAVD